MSKVRNGFVSNSSSSSFIVIGDGSKREIPKIDSNTLNVPNDFEGELEFGWGPDTLTDIGSRINFCWVQAQHKVKWLLMLEEALKETLDVNEIVWNLTTGSWDEDESKVWTYIDHQSNAYEGENIEMFASKEELINFIFDSESYIKLDNDNY